MTKRSIVLFLMIAIMTLSVAGPVSAAADKQAPGTITVTGHAEATAVPDIAFVTAGIVTNGPDVEAARSENDRIMRRIIDALAAQGIAREKITTSQFYLQPIYRSDAKEGGPGTISGYRLQNNITVAMEDLTKIGTVVDAMFQAGANQFQGLRFGLKNDDGLRDELLKKAVQDGRHKATIIAGALGINLGQPVSVEENGRMAPLALDGVRTLKAGAAGTPIEAGTLTIGMDVNLVFGIN